MILVLLLNAIFAATFPIIKEAMQQTTAYFLIALRLITAGTMLLTYQYVFNRKACKIKSSDILFFCKAAFFFMFLSFVPDAYGLKYLPSIKANFLWSLQPFISVLLGFTLYHERMGIKKGIGLVIGFLGTIPILLSQTPDEMIAAGDFFRISLPEAMVLLSAASTAYGLFLVKDLMDRKYSLITINGITMLMGGLLSFGALCTDQGFIEPWYTGSFMQLFGYVMLLIIGSNCIAYSLYGILLKRHSIVFLNFAGFTCPIFGAFFGWLFRNEFITWHYYLSFCFVFAGLYLFYKEEQETKKAGGA